MDRGTTSQDSSPYGTRMRPRSTFSQEPDSQRSHVYGSPFKDNKSYQERRSCPQKRSDHRIEKLQRGRARACSSLSSSATNEQHATSPFSDPIDAISPFSDPVDAGPPLSDPTDATSPFADPTDPSLIFEVTNAHIATRGCQPSPDERRSTQSTARDQVNADGAQYRNALKIHDGGSAEASCETASAKSVIVLDKSQITDRSSNARQISSEMLTDTRASRAVTNDAFLGTMDFPDESSPCNAPGDMLHTGSDCDSDLESEFPFNDHCRITKLEVPDCDTSLAEQYEQGYNSLQSALSYRRDRLISFAVKDQTLNDWSGDESDVSLDEHKFGHSVRPLFVVNKSPTRSVTNNRKSLRTGADHRSVLGEIDANPISQRDSRLAKPSHVHGETQQLFAVIPQNYPPTLSPAGELDRLHRIPSLETSTKAHILSTTPLALKGKRGRQSALNVKSAIQNFEDKIMENKSLVDRGNFQAEASSGVPKAIMTRKPTRNHMKTKVLGNRCENINIAGRPQEDQRDVR